ncbi:hypothetical protein bhYOR_001215 (plasmid) [Borrelia nietonii YOR]|nr:hypothetical protein [Borrelia nietonii]UPA09900.1 hypothetical protein bhYOR_001215 [Borrelia nietonii YOR]
MVKMRHHNLLLLLLLLVISCNLKSKEDSLLKDNLSGGSLLGKSSPRRSSFSSSSYGRDSFSSSSYGSSSPYGGSSFSSSSYGRDSFSSSSYGRSSFSSSSYGRDSFSNSSYGRSSSGGSLIGKGQFKKPALGARVGEDLPKSKKRNVRSTSEVDVGVDAEENVEVKLDKLLGTFKLQSDEIKEGIKYIQSVLTNYSIGKKSGFKTYTNDEFYSILVDLGELRLKEIIEFHLKSLKLQKEVGTAIDKIAIAEVRQSFKGEFDDFSEQYKFYLKDAFQSYEPNKISSMISLKNDSMKEWADNFDYLGLKALKLIEIEAQNKELSEEELKVIEFVRSVVTNSDIGSTEGYKTHSNVRFYSILGTLGPFRVKEMIEKLKVRFRELVDVRGVIKGINLKPARDELELACNNYEAIFKLSIKRAFNQYPVEYIHDDVIHGNWHMGKVLMIQKRATRFMEYENLYAGLSDDDQKAVEYLQNALTDPGIGRDKGYKTYSDVGFYEMLGKLGSSRLRKIIENMQVVLEMQEKALRAVESVKKDQLKEELKHKFLSEKQFYLIQLKEFFNSSAADQVYKAATKNDSSNRFIAIKNDALGM